MDAQSESPQSAGRPQLAAAIDARPCSAHGAARSRDAAAGLPASAGANLHVSSAQLGRAVLLRAFGLRTRRVAEAIHRWAGGAKSGLRCQAADPIATGPLARRVAPRPML